MKDELIKYYKSKLGSTFNPYDYQLEVAQQLLSGKNIVLSVPTGAGKTWASIIPFLFAKENQLKDFPTKMIYSLPLRTLTNSIHKSVSEILTEKAGIQTGEYNNDTYFEKDIIFSTIDQTLSSFLSFPLPLSERQANINAGALIGSYLVFDEFHLLNPNLSMATTLGMLKMLNNLCRCCIMTATLSSDFISMIEKELGYTRITLDTFPNDVPKIKSLIKDEKKQHKKTIEVCKEKLNADNIIKYHLRKTLVICNRVETAQQIFLDIQTKLDKKPEDIKLLCIHSRYFDKDRKIKESKISNLLGRGSNENIILITTQVIEAGMDISCEILHTEISPVNSFLQRVGRCARFEGESGIIFIYDVLDLEENVKISEDLADKEMDKKEIQKLNNKYLPYDSNLCKRTFVELCKYNYLNEKIAECLVNEILSEDEKKKALAIHQKNYNENEIMQSWRDCKKSNYSKTIRDINNLEIVLIDIEANRNKIIFPFNYETIGFFKWSFIKIAKETFSDNHFEDSWAMAIAEPNSDSSFDDDWHDRDGYKLKKINLDELKNHFGTVFVDKGYFSYSSTIGFNRFGQGQELSPFKESKEQAKKDYILKKDTFYQHNKALLNCFDHEFLPKIQGFAFTELKKFVGLNEIDFELLIKVMIVLHDYGKLNKDWQEPMQKYQSLKDNKEIKEILAHTDFDKENEHDNFFAKKAELHDRPGHAGIGAFVGSALLENLEINDILINVICNAIAKHHSSHTDNFSGFEIPDIGYNEIEILFNEIGVNADLIKKGRRGIIDGIRNEGEYLLYFFLVRILRLCDQKATESVEYYLNLKKRIENVFSF
jgi:CRISPR-associated endonuclease/helicase Cas3